MGWSGDRLVIVKRNMELWAYSGTPGRDSLKRLNGPQIETRASNIGGRVGMTKNGEIWAIKPGLDYPHRLVNNRFVGLPYLSLFPDDTGYLYFPYGGSITSGTGNDDLIMVVRSGDENGLANNKWRFAWFRNGAWSFHTINSDGGTLEVSSAIQMIYSDGIYESLVLTSVGDRAHVIHNNNNSPGAGVNDRWSNGDDSELEPVVCTLDTSTYIVPRMKETRIKKVALEFESPEAGATGLTVGITVSVIGNAADGEEVTLALGSWASVAGDREGNYRVVFTPDGDIPLTRFRVSLSLTHVVISAITVTMEEDDEDTRG